MVSATGAITVVLADEHPLTLAGVVAVLAGSSDFSLVGKTGSGVEALKMLLSLQPRLALIGMTLPDMSGIAIAQQATAASCPTRIAILSAQKEQAYVDQALLAGAKGYLLKRTSESSLPGALRAIDAGGLYLDPAVASRYILPWRRDHSSTNGGPPSSPLSQRETEVLQLIACGYTSKEVAMKLGLAAKSVETYKARSTEKLGITGRAQLLQYALLNGWLEEFLM